MTVAEVLAQIRAELAARVDAVYREGARNFSREPVDLWGVRAPDVKQIARAVYHDVKPWPPAQRDEFMDGLWKSDKLEEAGVAIYLYRRFRMHCGAREFRLFTSWVDSYVTNWAACDGVSSWLLAACVENDPALIRRLPAWTRSRNR